VELVNPLIPKLWNISICCDDGVFVVSRKELMPLLVFCNIEKIPSAKA